MDRTEELIAANDLDGLVAWAMSLVLDEHWPALVELRDACRAALSRGLQLWPAAASDEYRMALDGPGSLAASVLGSSAERFTLGPFAEVAASTHSWTDLAPHLDRSPSAASFAHERVLQGENLTSEELPDIRDLPLRLELWEPASPTAIYLPDRARFDAPELSTQPVPSDLRRSSAPLRPDEATDALRSLLDGWTGGVVAVGVEGDAVGAVAALGTSGPGSVRLSRLYDGEALAWMAWAGASGGTNGRRRGMAAGRSKAWWAAAAVGGLDLDASIDSDELGDAIAELCWYLVDRGRPPTGRTLTLAVEDPDHGLAWALDGHDRGTAGDSYEAAHGK